MDVLIKNMELPKDNSITLIIHPDGHITFPSQIYSCDYRLPTCPKAIELPPHGDLIDRQTVLSYFETGYSMGADMDYEDVVAIVSNEKAIPTILEAST